MLWWMGLFAGGWKTPALFICHSNCHVPLWFVPVLWRPQVAKGPPFLLLTCLPPFFFFLRSPQLLTSIPQLTLVSICKTSLFICREQRYESIILTRFYSMAGHISKYYKLASRHHTRIHKAAVHPLIWILHNITIIWEWKAPIYTLINWPFFI